MRKRLNIAVYLEAEDAGNEAVLESMIQRMFNADENPLKRYLIATMIESYAVGFKRIQVTNPKD